MKYKTLPHNLMAIIAIFFLVTTNTYAFQLYMPSTILISPTGVVTHFFNFPQQSGLSAFQAPGASSSGFFPLPILEINNFKRIYAEEDKSKVPGEMIQKDGIFIPAKNPSGYRVIEKRNISLGLSLSSFLAILDGWLGLGVSIGGAYIYGKGYLASRWAPTLEGVDNLPEVKVPENLEMVKNWKVGDTLTTTKSGSIVVNANLWIMAGTIGSVGVCALLNTTWNTGLEIMEPADKNSKIPQIKLIYSKDEGAKIGFNAGNITSSINLEKSWGKNKSFEYIFDLSNPNTTDLEVESFLKGKKISKTFKNVSSLLAYQAALGGNLILADLLSNHKNKGVIKVSEARKKYNSKDLTVSGFIPWLFSASLNLGSSFIGGRTKVFGDDLLLEEMIGIYTKKSGTEGLLSNDMKRISTFSGNFQQITPLNDLDGTIQRRYSGNYKYYYIRNKVKGEEVKEELKKLRYKVGFMKELKEAPIPEGQIGTFEIDLDITLSNIATDELIKLTKEFPQEVFVNEAQEYIDGFFKEVKDAKEEICESYRVRILKECIFTTKRQSASAIKTAYAALLKMSKLRNNMDFKNFVQAYADFGRGFIENRFTMKTFLRMLRNDFNPNLKGEKKFGKEKLVMVDGKLSKIPYEIILNIKGTNITPYRKVLYTYKL